MTHLELHTCHDTFYNPTFNNRDRYRRFNEQCESN